MRRSLPAVNFAGYVNADIGHLSQVMRIDIQIAAHPGQQVGADFFFSVLEGGECFAWPYFMPSFCTRHLQHAKPPVYRASVNGSTLTLCEARLSFPVGARQSRAVGMRGTQERNP